MPTYEYACKSCGNLWEEVQRITESPRTECPKCHQATAERQISGGTFILKGGGWYADAYSSKPSSGDAKSEKTDKPEKTDKSDKTESKTEKAKETKETTAAAPAAPATTTPSTPSKTD